MSSEPLPETCKAAVLYQAGEDLRIESIPTPQPVYGTVVIRVEAAPLYGPWKKMMFSSTPLFVHPTPFVPGALAIGRIAAVGPDTTSLEVGQLVMAEYFIRARDNPDGVQFLRSANTFRSPGGTKLASDLYRNGSFAEYMLVAHENCHAIDERLFLGSPSDGGLGYTTGNLGWLCWQAICYSGLRDIGLQAGETIVIMPATGVFGGAAVEVASAMGARVIAGGRNENALQKLAQNVPNVKTVRLTGDVAADTAAIQKIHGSVDAYLDISPPTMPDTKHLQAGLMSLTTYGRASIMGIMSADIPLNYGLCVLKSLTLRGRFMFSRDTVRDLIKLAASGLLKASRIAVVAQFKLEDWKKAFDVAEETHGWGKMVTILP